MYDQAAQTAISGFFIIVVLFVQVVCGGFSAFVADEKGRSVAAWFFLGLLFGPIALLAIVGVPILTTHTVQQRQPRQQRPRTPVNAPGQSVPGSVAYAEQQTRNRQRREELRQLREQREREE